jgi:hypothetical protein
MVAWRVSCCPPFADSTGQGETAPSPLNSGLRMALELPF